MNKITTLEQAMQYRYGCWAGKPSGVAYNAGRCAAEVMTRYLFRQCTRSSGHGPDGLYCKQHAKKFVGRE